MREHSNVYFPVSKLRSTKEPLSVVIVADTVLPPLEVRSDTFTPSIGLFVSLHIVPMMSSAHRFEHLELPLKVSLLLFAERNGLVWIIDVLYGDKLNRLILVSHIALSLLDGNRLFVYSYMHDFCTRIR